MPLTHRVPLRASFLLAAVALAGCGASSPSDAASEDGGLTLGTLSNSGSMSGTDTDASDSNADDSNADGTDSNSSDSANSTTDDTPKFDVGGVLDVPGGCGAGGDVEVDESFIWVPGTTDGTVAKIDTRTMVEVARYNIGPSGGTESASRTAVSGDGRYVVVNSRGTGRSTAVAANIADCVDRNMDGVITTSQNATDILAWDTDECVVWTTVHADWGGSAQAGPRGITWTIGDWNEATCSFINQKVWLGYLAAAGNAHLIRLDGTSGTLEEDLTVAGWVGNGYAPYGGALDPQDRPWFTGLRGELVRVNTDNDPIDVTRITQPANIQSYGMTVDPNGDPWMAGCSGPVSTYDVATASWVSIPDTSACHRGMAVDQDFHVWVASNSPCELVEIDGETRTLIARHPLAQCSTPIGVSVDVDGYVWLVDQAGWAWKIDPNNVPAMEQVLVPGNHYVYSDMTGGQLKSVTNPPG
ncbi:MAG: lyase [Nannocystales bacterium]